VNSRPRAPAGELHGRDPPTRGAPDSKTNLRRVNMSSTERARPVGGLRGVNGANCSSSHPNPPEDGKGSNPSLSACQTYLGARPLLACASRTLRIQRPRGSAGAPQTPSAGMAPLGASLPLPCAFRPRRLLYASPRGRRAVAARSCARRRREPRQVRKEAAVPNVLLCRRAP